MNGGFLGFGRCALCDPCIDEDMRDWTGAVLVYPRVCNCFSSKDMQFIQVRLMHGSSSYQAKS